MIVVAKKSSVKFIWVGFLTVGVFLLMQVMLPIVSFQVWATVQQRNDMVLVSPQITEKGVLGISIQNKDNFPTFVSSVKRTSLPGFDKFSLSIPRIKIEKENVWVDTNDLSQGLVQLPGSSLPGEKGNVFISGHSALSQFFNLKTVPFSKLPDLKKGDQIIIEALGSKFIYEVYEFKIVSPSDVSVLLPPDDQGRYISLMTCVPPGLNFKRLVAIGKML